MASVGALKERTTTKRPKEKGAAPASPLDPRHHGFLPTLPGLDPELQRLITDIGKWGSSGNPKERIRSANAIEPPPFYQEFFRLRGDCEVNSNDPDLKKFLS
eukprot:TRINITY_DN2382_c0_g2_i3.p1 TRINITY_DN2382_c0_g2~~TRINITY_DN2382_c0_g2_i3.p1  ORF type:complete len:109 (+),score=10.14 TRINITY_DN2382_c0_g2_i3:23-328(+)